MSEDNYEPDQEQEERDYAWFRDEIASKDDEIARLREERRWISVGERLSENWHPVLVWDGHTNQIAWMDGAKWMNDGEVYMPVTHWQPLPGPPEGE